LATVANHPSSRWPATSFLLCGAQPAVAETLGLLTVPHFLPLYASLEDALDAAVEQLARAWGVNRHPDGGNVIWCTLTL
jgi:hypothetical protein